MHRQDLGGRGPGGAVLQTLGRGLWGTERRESLPGLVSLAGFVLREWSSVRRDSRSLQHLACAQKGDNLPSSESTKVVFTHLWP